MKKPIVIFITKVFLFCLPIIVLLSFYIIIDPFKVIYHYDSYFVSGMPSYVVLDKDYVSTETFLNNFSKYNYDSFIFGNSRSIFYQVKDWQEHIASKRCFHFDASLETLYGLNAKFKFLMKKGIPIRNVLLILDWSILPATNNSSGHLFLKDPKLSGQNWLLFQIEFVKAFFDINFLHDYIDFRLTNKIEKSLMNDGVLDDRPFEYDLTSNEIRFSYYENIINTNPYDYYLPRKSLFYERSAWPQQLEPIIKDEQTKLLEEIFDILIQNKAEYRIVISPLYDQIKLNTEDYDYLCNLFGRKNVYDFSGRNEITNNVINYYDNSHYRPHVTKYILDVIYKK